MIQSKIKDFQEMKSFLSLCQRVEQSFGTILKFNEVNY